MIRHDKDLFFLDAGSSQAVVGLFKGKWPVLYHWGQPLSAGDLNRLSAAPNGYCVFGDTADKSYTPNRLPFEYPCGENGDFRSPAFIARDALGRPCLDLSLTGWSIIDGGSTCGDLPVARVEAGDLSVQTLILRMEDAVTGLAVELRYSTVDGVLVRSTRFENCGSGDLFLDRAFSFNVDIHSDREMDIIALDGAWGRERQLRRFDLPSGRWETGSRRGISSHQAWPGVVVTQRDATEEYGEVWGATLVWSGDWTLGVERDEDGLWRIQGGLHPEFHRRTLVPGESFCTPQALLLHSNQGLSGFSALSHAFVRERILPPNWAGRTRPVIANNWEATYFSFTEERLLEIADEAAACGVETFVLDDGWFGSRDDDRSSLGDWVPHSVKFPDGLGSFASELGRRGLGFGLWFEPEMVSPDSDLYRLHPDWCLHLDQRQRSESRHQLILDLSREDVRDYIVESVSRLLTSTPISYVKWDMNRPFSHAGVDRFAWTMGLYDILKRLTSCFPEILFEGCAGGGGRMDLGLLYFVPQFWTSDNTDALARLTIQEGTSLFLPHTVMGAHVSAVPNHQTGRITRLSARTRAAFIGAFGYELDFNALTDGEKARIREDTAWYKEHREAIQSGVFRRTRTSISDPNTIAWQIHARGEADIYLFWFKPRSEANSRFPLYRWSSLDPAARYAVSFFPRAGETEILGGDELMHRGLPIPLTGGDGEGALVHLRRV